MRKSGGLAIPLTIIIAYYAFWTGLTVFVMIRFPELRSLLPIGGVQDLATSNVDGFEPVYSHVERSILSANGPLQLLLASVGALIYAVPISWVYFITSRQSRIGQSFLQTIMILPVVVTGISTIVLNSLALAFALAGIVAAVRFRFTLNQPSDAMYIFVTIAIGLAAGIGAVGVAGVISFMFVVTTLLIWRLEYGKTLSGPFLTMLTRRDPEEDDY